MNGSWGKDGWERVREMATRRTVKEVECALASFVTARERHRRWGSDGMDAVAVWQCGVVGGGHFYRVNSKRTHLSEALSRNTLILHHCHVSFFAHLHVKTIQREK